MTSRKLIFGYLNFKGRGYIRNFSKMFKIKIKYTWKGEPIKMLMNYLNLNFEEIIYGRDKNADWYFYKNLLIFFFNYN